MQSSRYLCVVCCAVLLSTSPGQTQPVKPRPAATPAVARQESWQPITELPTNIERRMYWMVMASVLGRNLAVLPEDQLQLPPTGFAQDEGTPKAQTIFQLIKEQMRLTYQTFAAAAPAVKGNLSDLQTAVTSADLIRVNSQWNLEIMAQAEQLPAAVFLQMINQVWRIGSQLEDYMRHHKLGPYRIAAQTSMTVAKKLAMYEDWRKACGQFLQLAEQLPESAYQSPLDTQSSNDKGKTLASLAKETAQQARMFLHLVKRGEEERWPEFEQCTNKIGVLNLYRRIQAEGETLILGLTDNSTYEVTPAFTLAGDGTRPSVFKIIGTHISHLKREVEQEIKRQTPGASKERN